MAGVTMACLLPPSQPCQVPLLLEEKMGMVQQVVASLGNPMHQHASLENYTANFLQIAMKDNMVGSINGSGN